MNWNLSESEITFVLDDFNARAVVAHENLGPQMLAAIGANRARALILLAIGTTPGCGR